MATNINPIDPRTLGAISHNNFFLSTKAFFLECSTPERLPDYNSTSGSCYWLGSDSLGAFVIRQSDHWCQYFVNNDRKTKLFRSRIRSCSWNIIISPPIIDTEIIRWGKCYLKDFERITWRTKKRYEVIK